MKRFTRFLALLPFMVCFFAPGPEKSIKDKLFVNKRKGFEMPKKNYDTFTRSASYLVIILMLCFQMGNAVTQTITNNRVWNDVTNTKIKAQGGWILQVGSTFYWYGMDYTESGNNFNGIKCYSSTDLKNWTSQGNVATAATFNGRVGWIGRPIVVYNNVTSKYVMWCEGPSTVPGYCVLTNNSPTGLYTWTKSARKYYSGAGQDLGSIFVESNGDAYVSYNSDNGCTNNNIRINKLNANYDSIVADNVEITTGCQSREASCIFKRGSTYYIFMSETVGWGSSPTHYRTAPSITGPWSSDNTVITNPSSGNSYDTQHDFVLQVAGSSGTTYMYCGDRWSNWRGADISTGFYQWSPISFNGSGVPTINGFTTWYIDAPAGTWSSSPVSTQQQVGENAGTPGKGIHYSPAENTLTFKGASGNAVIYSLNGKRLSSRYISQGTTSIDLSDLPRGVYFADFDHETATFVKI